MKKCLILMLVLGMTSMASAVVVDAGLNPHGGPLDVVVGTTLTITVTAGLDGNWLGYVIVDEGGVGALGNALVLPAAGGMGSAVPYAEAGWGVGYNLTAAENPPGTAVVGNQFTVDFMSLDLGTALVSLWNDAADPTYTTPVDTLAINVIPEPMTIALLGLGSLFLLRRRK